MMEGSDIAKSIKTQQKGGSNLKQNHVPPLVCSVKLSFKRHLHQYECAHNSRDAPALQWIV